jgi:hypothetical protein
MVSLDVGQLEHRLAKAVHFACLLFEKVLREAGVGLYGVVDIAVRADKYVAILKPDSGRASWTRGARIRRGAGRRME